MNFETFFFVTSGVESIIVAVFFLVLTVSVIGVLIAARRMERKVSEAIDRGTDYVNEAGENISRMTAAVIDFITYKILETFKRRRR